MPRSSSYFLRLVLCGWFCALAAQSEAVFAAPPMKGAKAAIITGHDGPFHKWKETSEALQEVLEEGKDFQVTVQTDVEYLASSEILELDLIVLNYCNWGRAGLSDAAKDNLLKYLKAGKGLAIVHFACGAFHPQLPGGKDGDWPEYRKICRRWWTWGKSGHDAHGPFEVEIVPDHSITAGLESFRTIDELYCKLEGEEPITVLASARCQTTGRDEPQAFAYAYGDARVFQTTLGHSANSIRNPGAAALIRRGSLWAAGMIEAAAQDPKK